VIYRHRNCRGQGKGGPHFIATCSQHQLMCLLHFLLSVVAAYYVEIMSTSVVLPPYISLTVKRYVGWCCILNCNSL